ncbi:hypothetical protein FLL45_09285 [Aliikangiella marina]|uniref:Beta-propeller domain-containing protein n=1 Tax=Aliikangiella marina TaxID=1712262 RepID=A0A545TD27_9GAMM|nr:beta-propeller domain-containing protein [Aliikangiella marina]TQV75120.1 hypothetical protein FLL45_09285 [Aliikangiella marina]
MVNRKNFRSNRQSIKSMLAAVGIATLISACGGDDEKLNIDYSELKLAKIKDQPLAITSQGNFERYLKNGIRLRLGSSIYEPDMLASPADGGAVETQFSTTNVHEIGVDEDDRLKYNGEHLFLMEDGYFPLSSPELSQRIRIMATNPETADASEVAMIENSGDNLPFSGMYLHELADSDYLVSISASRFYAWNSFFIDSYWSWGSGKTQIQIHDVTTPENPALDWQIEIEGSLEGSRRIGNKLYLITRYVPNIEALNNNAQTDDEKRQNELLIRNTPISDLLPHYQINNGGIRSLVGPQDCFVTQEIDQNEGYADVITLTSIDLDSRGIESSVCLNANVSGIYSSTESLYIGSSGPVDWLGGSDGTSIHKFSLTEQGVNYRGSGWTEGFMGWSDPAFRMNEHQGYLRMVTTFWENGERKHRLSVFEETTNNQLAVVAMLPNSDNPAPIGKPGEDIFAVRFVEDKAYIITFLRIDPLYQIDLSDPLNPVIASELEMPGFARYLHPLADGWLLGIGQDVENDIPRGVKLELYDLRDPNNPQVKDTIKVGDIGSWTEALNDLRAISFLPISQDVRQLALPIDRYEAGSAAGNSGWIHSGLYTFEISGFNSGELSLSHSGTMITESRDENTTYPRHWQRGRSTLTPDSIYFYRGNQLWSARQNDIENVIGPH